MILHYQAVLPATHPYLINKYTYWYYTIISNAQSRVNNPDSYVERHHIIPVCFFVDNRSKGKTKGWLTSNPHEPNNIVRLTAREHFVCHWLLTKMTSGKSYHMMETALSAFRMMHDGHARILSSMEYQRIKLAHRLSKKGVKRSRPSPLKGRKQTIKMNWYTNGIEERKIENAPSDPSWYPGRVSSPIQGKPNLYTQGTKWWHNGDQQKMAQACPGPEWVLGRLPPKLPKKRPKPYQRNPHSQRCRENISKANKGKLLYNNGEIMIKTADDPGPGWVRGYLPGKLRKSNQTT